MGVRCGYWILDTGYWILDTRYWLLVSGFSFLVVCFVNCEAILNIEH